MGHFPHRDLTPLQVEALVILAEECSELAKECSKILRFGPNFEKDGSTAVDKMNREILDVQLLVSIVESLGLHGDIDEPDYLVRKAMRLDLNSNLGPAAAEVIR